MKHDDRFVNEHDRFAFQYSVNTFFMQIASSHYQGTVPNALGIQYAFTPHINVALMSDLKMSVH